MIYTFPELLQAKLHLEYVCFPLLTKGGILVVGAPAKSRKSYFAMNLAYKIAEGEDFLGFKIARPRKVLYVEKEIGLPGVRGRMAEMHRKLQGSYVDDNLLFLPKSKSTRNLMLDAPEGRSTLLKIVEEYNPDIVVLDPLRRFHRQDEDKSGGMEIVFDAIDELQGEEARRSIIVVHHCGKPSLTRDMTDPMALRGSSFIFDAGDSYIMIGSGGKGSKKHKLYFRFRHSEDLPDMSVEFEGGAFQGTKRVEE